MRRALLFPVMLLFCMPSLVMADFILFKNGRQIEGEILKETDTILVLKVQFGTMQVEKDKILSIRKESDAQKAQRKAIEEEQRLYADRMIRLGKVLYKGEWIPEEEKTARIAKITEKRRLKAEAKKKAAAEKKKAAEEKRKAREKFLQEEAKRNSDLSARERLKDRRQNVRQSRDERNRRGNSNRNDNKKPFRNGPSRNDRNQSDNRDDIRYKNYDR